MSNFLIIFAAACWGTTGTFSRFLFAKGFSSMQVAEIRSLITVVLIFFVLLVTDRNLFKIKLRHVPLFLGMGIISQGIFEVLYLTSISELKMSVAAILLYTAPFFVILMSAAIYHEKITIKKLVCLVVAFAGCVLTSGVIGGGGSLSVLGLLAGLGAGLTYGLYSIFCSTAVKHYSTYTVTFYTFLIATLFLLPLCDPLDAIQKLAGDTSAICLGVTVALVSAFIPYLAYTKGLEKVKPGKASIMAFAEPMVATVLGFVVFDEKLSYMSIAGIVLIFAAIVVLNTGSRTE